MRYVLLCLVFLVACDSPTTPSLFPGTYVGDWPSSTDARGEVTMTFHGNGSGVYDVESADVSVRRFFSFTRDDGLTVDFRDTYCPDLPTFTGTLSYGGVQLTGIEKLHGPDCAVTDSFPVNLRLTRTP